MRRVSAKRGINRSQRKQRKKGTYCSGSSSTLPSPPIIIIASFSLETSPSLHSKLSALRSLLFSSSLSSRSSSFLRFTDDVSLPDVGIASTASSTSLRSFSAISETRLVTWAEEVARADSSESMRSRVEVRRKRTSLGWILKTSGILNTGVM